MAIGAVASLFAEIIIPLVSLVVETTLHVLVASIRPWCYLFSPSFRATVNAQYARRHPLLKVWHLLWGSVLLLTSCALLATIIWLVTTMRQGQAPDPGLRHQALQATGHAVSIRIKEYRDTRQNPASR